VAAPAGLVATYKYEDEGGPRFRDLRVVAFRAEDGEPVVVAGGRLCVAAELAGFETVQEIDLPVGVVTGGGQRARLRYPRRTVDVPVIGWLIFPDHARAIVATPDSPGYGESISLLRRFDDDVEVVDVGLPYRGEFTDG
jgi:hypothetical protein